MGEGEWHNLLTAENFPTQSSSHLFTTTLPKLRRAASSHPPQPRTTNPPVKGTFYDRFLKQTNTTLVLN